MRRAKFAGSFVSILEVRPGETELSSKWSEGPLVLRLDDSGGGEFLIDPEQFESRSGHAGRYLSRVDGALYKNDIRRWSRVDDCLVEMLSMTAEGASPDDALGALENYTHLLVVRGALKPSASVDDVGRQIDEAVAAVICRVGIQYWGRSYRMVVAVVPPSGMAYSDDHGSGRGDFHLERAVTAWQLAKRRSDEPSHGELSRLAETQNLSEPTADMSLLIHHDGAALVLFGDGSNSGDPFSSWLDGEPAETTPSVFAQWNFQTVITDCVLLGLLQRSGLNKMADRLARASAARPDVETMLILEGAFSRFKATVWWRHVTEEETGNMVLAAFQSKHRLDTLFDEVARDLAEYSGQVQALTAALSSAAVTILTLTLFPLTVLVALITAVTPASASFLVKLIAYLSAVPISLVAGLGVASRIPDYLPFLKSTLDSRRR